MKNEYTSLNMGKKIKCNHRSLKIYTILYKHKMVQPRLRNSECLILQGMSSLLATKISTLAVGLEEASSRSHSRPLYFPGPFTKFIKGHSTLGLPLTAPMEAQPRGKGALSKALWQLRGSPSWGQANQTDNRRARWRTPNSREAKSPTSIDRPCTKMEFRTLHGAPLTPFWLGEHRRLSSHCC